MVLKIVMYSYMYRIILWCPYFEQVQRRRMHLRSSSYRLVNKQLIIQRLVFMFISVSVMNTPITLSLTCSKSKNKEVFFLWLNSFLRPSLGKTHRVQGGYTPLITKQKTLFSKIRLIQPKKWEEKEKIVKIRFRLLQD